MNTPIMGVNGGSVDSSVSPWGRYKVQIMAGVFYLFLLSGCGFHLRGEMVLSPREMMVQFLDYLQPSYWRVGELNKIGLNPDNYCNSSEPKISVIVRRGDAI